MKLTNGFQKFPAVFNLKELPVGDFQNDDLLQGKMANLVHLKMIIIFKMTICVL